MTVKVSTPRPDDFKSKAKRAWKAAEALRVLAKRADRLPHSVAVQRLRSLFGNEFLHANRNGNPAICRHVLSLFEMFTEAQLVWAWRGRYWRRRRPGDPPEGRKVAY